MPDNDLEVFDYLISDEGEPREVDCIAYAIFAYRKRHWVQHFQEQNDRFPNQVEIDDWISQQTEYDFERMRSEAADFFDRSSKTYLADYIEAEKKKAVDTSILNAVEKHISPWRDALIALMMAITAPIVLGFVIFLIGIFDSNFPVHIIFGQHASH